MEKKPETYLTDSVFSVLWVERNTEFYKAVTGATCWGRTENLWFVKLSVILTFPSLSPRIPSRGLGTNSPDTAQEQKKVIIRYHNDEIKPTSHG